MKFYFVFLQTVLLSFPLLAKTSELSSLAEILSYRPGMKGAPEQVAQLPPGKIKAALQNYLNVANSLEKDSEVHTARLANALLDIVEIASVPIADRKAALSAAQPLILVDDADRAAPAVGRFQSLTRQLLQAAPESADLYYFATFFDDSYSPTSLSRSLTSLEKCAKLEPHHKFCPALIPIYKKRLAMPKCQGSEMKPGPKIRLERVEVSKSGEEKRTWLADLDMSSLVQGVKEDDGNAITTLTGEGVRRLKEATGKYARVEAALVLRDVRVPLGMVRSLYAMNIEYIPLGKIPLDDFCPVKNR